MYKIKFKNGKIKEFKTLLYADLSHADLSGANLYRANLRGVDLYRANLRGVDLYRANLFDANLSHANLLRTTGNGCEVISLNIDPYHLVYCRQTGILKGGCRSATLDEWLNLDTIDFSINEINFYNDVTVPFIKMLKR